MTTFESLGLDEPIMRAVTAAGYTEATPIQAQAVPPALKGCDLLGCAQTGTGKTAAFSLPILQRLAAHPGRRGRRPIRCLIVTPTRELAAQIGESLETYGKYLHLRSLVIFGGVSQVRQVSALERGTDILVATPGRLLDLIGQKHIDLSRVEILVLDEADRMLDMGFVHDVRRIVALVPDERQTLFFSATMPPAIRELASGMLRDPVHVSITPPATTAETVSQHVYMVDREDKQQLLVHLLERGDISKALVFTRTKHGADRVARKLARAGIGAAAIHGNKSQNARVRALEGFRRGDPRVLIASDIAARGLDIDDVTHVINFDLPNEPETYVHRIGRTGRAGAQGAALSFCSLDERDYLRDIERTVRIEVPVARDNPLPAAFDKLPVEKPAAQPRPAGTGGRRRRRGGRGGSGDGRASTAGRPASNAPRAPGRGEAPPPRAGRGQTTARKPAERKPAERKPAERKPAERKPAERKPAERKTAERKPAGRAATAGSPASERASDAAPRRRSRRRR